MVAYGRLNTKKHFTLLALKVVAVAYERWSQPEVRLYFLYRFRSRLLRCKYFLYVQLKCLRYKNRPPVKRHESFQKQDRSPNPRPPPSPTPPKKTINMSQNVFKQKQAMVYLILLPEFLDDFKKALRINFHLLIGLQRLTFSKPVGKHPGGTQKPLLGAYMSFGIVKRYSLMYFSVTSESYRK